jgi:16S rRNA processing protein RimM
MPPARILVGVIGAPHGVRGEVRVKPFTEDPLALKKYGPLESEDGKTFKLESARIQGDMVVAKFEGISDRDAAAKLTNLQLYVSRDRLPPPDDGEYYHSDLIGLRVEDESGALIGIVAAIPNFGAGDLLEVAREGRDSVHVPFTDEFVPAIEIASGRVVIAPPDGLLDDTAENNDEERG